MCLWIILALLRIRQIIFSNLMILVDNPKPIGPPINPKIENKLKGNNYNIVPIMKFYV